MAATGNTNPHNCALLSIDTALGLSNSPLSRQSPIDLYSSGMAPIEREWGRGGRGGTGGS